MATKREEVSLHTGPGKTDGGGETRTRGHTRVAVRGVGLLLLTPPSPTTPMLQIGAQGASFTHDVGPRVRPGRILHSELGCRLTYGLTSNF